MNIVILEGIDYGNDNMDVVKNIKNDPVFLTKSSESLCDYIENLKLRVHMLYRLRICKEMDIDVTLIINGKEPTKHEKLSSLMKELDISRECMVIVNGDAGDHIDSDKEKKVRTQLANIIQQMLYVNIPLSKVSVMTEKEARDAERVNRFIQSSEAISASLSAAVRNMDGMKKTDAIYVNGILEKLKKMQEFVNEAMDNELTISVAASKKSGKSVIVNSLIGCEIAPTSLTLPTPNNCIYKINNRNSKYYMRYQGKMYTFDNIENIRRELLRLFKEAEKAQNVGKRFALEDMEIFYPPVMGKSTSLSKFTVYDTPGPDFVPKDSNVVRIDPKARTANGENQETAAEVGINAADVIVFVIDYSKHLIDSEFEYLVKVKKLCEKNRKNYSLIICVNMLDRRYDSEDDKNTVRIIDLIRQKLIEHGKLVGMDFSDCIFLGTSALTYFDALVAPDLKCPDGDCSILRESFDMETLDELLESYDESSEDISPDYEDRARTILSKLYTMLSSAKSNEKKNITSLEEMKHFSGMPNFIKYLEYIANCKARNEKVNNLLFKIDTLYTEIRNTLNVDELLRNIERTGADIEKTRALMRDFMKEVDRVLDPKYTDLHEKYKSQIFQSKKYKSDILSDLAKKMPIDIREAAGIWKAEVDDQLSFNSVATEVTNDLIPKELNRKLRDTYSADKSLKIDGISEDYLRYLSEAATNATSGYLSYRREEYIEKLEREENGIKNTFTYILNYRIDELKKIIEKYSSEMYEICQQYLDIDLPDFQTSLSSASVASVYNGYVISDTTYAELRDRILQAMNELNRYNDKKTGNWLTDSFRRLALNNRISLDNLIKVYSYEKLALKIKYAYEENGALEQYLDSSMRTPLKKDINDFIDHLYSDLEMITGSLLNGIEQIYMIIDDSGDKEKKKEELSRQKAELDEIRKAVRIFIDKWENVKYGK